MSCWICMARWRGGSWIKKWKKRLPGLWCRPWHFHDGVCLLPSLFGVRAAPLSPLRQRFSSVSQTHGAFCRIDRDSHLDTGLFTACVKKQTPLKWAMRRDLRDCIVFMFLKLCALGVFFVCKLPRKLNVQSKLWTLDYFQFGILLQKWNYFVLFSSTKLKILKDRKEK